MLDENDEQFGDNVMHEEAGVKLGVIMMNGRIL